MAYRQDLRAEQVSAYVSVKCERDVKVTDLTRLSSGHSRETLLASFDQDAGIPDMVFRIEQGGVLGTYSEPEFRLLQTLHGGPVSVPRPIWLETDPHWFGYPFIVFERVAGDGGVEYLADPEERRTVLREYISTIARMHALTLDEIGLQGPETPRDTRASTLKQLAFWADIYRRYRFAPEPLLDEAILWLERNVPEPKRKVSLVHGDLGAGNFILQDGKVGALIDWEWSNLGDPMEDVAFLGYIKGWAFGPPEETLALFREYSQFPIDEHDLYYWEVWNYVKGACSNIATLQVFCEGRNYGLNMVAIGTAGFLGFTARAARTLRQPPGTWKWRP